ncbi:F-box domain-containing protein [Mycena indigotica]|uniref:F-box domain-containing protein n=1 Tax=Mycena indigotica TaxID=2126181 RepID=A0A8H6VU81_9AGAR|nr:F-box domain-containing protein [Mycena indigotica]KAF7292126.1 F-box domain-containing protein [Mycena indigotica]
MSPFAPSPFQSILATNAVPTASHRQDIRVFLTTPLAELAGLEEEVARLQVLVEESKIRLKAQKEVAGGYEALISPLRGLPDDLVRAIFLETLPVSRAAAFVADEGPMLLCRVCRAWKELALTTPRLWASMHIVFPEVTRVPRVVAMVSTWLACSGAVPLSISIVASRMCGREANYQLQPLLALLIPHARRWQSLEIEFHPEDKSHDILGQLRTEEVPLLRHFKMSFYHHPSGYDVYAPPPLLTYPFLRTPSLRSFNYTGQHSTAPRIVPWANLHHLKLFIYESNSGAQVLPSIVHARQLRTLDISIRDEFGPIPEAELQVTFPYLEELRIDTYDPESAKHFLRALHAPQLTRLMHSVFRAPADMAEPLRLAKESIRGLSEFEVVLRACSLEHLRALLHAMPTLESLTVVGEPHGLAAHWDEHDAEFLELFVPPLGAPPVVPLLRVLKLSQVTWTANATILGVLRGRVGQSAIDNGLEALRMVEIDFGRARGKNEELASEGGVKEAVNAGTLELVVKYRPQMGWTYSLLEGTERDEVETYYDEY